MTSDYGIELVRFAEIEGATLGAWILPRWTNLNGVTGALAIPTLEPPWKDNARDESCIPAGSYQLVPILCPEHGATWRFVGGSVGDFALAERTKVEPHTGNTLIDTKGCPLPGMAFGRVQGMIAVVNSRPAMEILREALPRDRAFPLTIRNVGSGELRDGQLPKGLKL